jgi:hypothetical protein
MLKRSQQVGRDAGVVGISWWCRWNIATREARNAAKARRHLSMEEELME